MSFGYCTGCGCKSTKSIVGPNFTSCRTRHTGGICGILVTCIGPYNYIPSVHVNFADQTNFSSDLYDYLLNIGVDNSDNLTLATNVLQQNSSSLFHYWCVDADMPETEDEVEEATNCYAKSVVDRTQKVVGDILDVNTDNYRMMQEYQCEATQLRIWFLTTSGQFYGGPKGINASVVKFNYSIPRGVKELQKLSFEFEWDCKVQPPRHEINWPLPNPGFS